MKTNALKNNLRLGDISWIEEHEWYFTGINRALSREEIQTLFLILSWIEGREKKPTGCGRCVTSAKERVWQEYLNWKKYQSQVE
jgi:hypothetical protein